jgi:hypothetical protein
MAAAAPAVADVLFPERGFPGLGMILLKMLFDFR